jgi:hypothetical protein
MKWRDSSARQSRISNGDIAKLSTRWQLLRAVLPLHFAAAPQTPLYGFEYKRYTYCAFDLNGAKWFAFV